MVSFSSRQFQLDFQYTEYTEKIQSKVIHNKKDEFCKTLLHVPNKGEILAASVFVSSHNRTQ